MAKTVMEAVRCRQCGAETRAWQPKYCWLCHALLGSPTHDVPLRPAIAQQRVGNTFGLATLIVVVAFCAVLVGVFLESPGLGILLAIVGTPSLIATLVIAAQRGSTDRPMTMLDEFANFMVAAGSVVGILVSSGVASGVAFFIQCLQPW